MGIQVWVWLFFCFCLFAFTPSRPSAILSSGPYRSASSPPCGLASSRHHAFTTSRPDESASSPRVLSLRFGLSSPPRFRLLSPRCFGFFSSLRFCFSSSSRFHLFLSLGSASSPPCALASSRHHAFNSSRPDDLASSPLCAFSSSLRFCLFSSLCCPLLLPLLSYFLSFGFLSSLFFVCLCLLSIPLLLPLRSRVFTSPCPVAISRLLSLYFRLLSPCRFSFFPFLCFYLPSSLSFVAFLVPPSHRLKTSRKVLAPACLLPNGCISTFYPIAIRLQLGTFRLVHAVLRRHTNVVVGANSLSRPVFILRSQLLPTHLPLGFLLSTGSSPLDFPCRFLLPLTINALSPVQLAPAASQSSLHTDRRLRRHLSAAKVGFLLFRAGCRRWRC